MKVQIRRNVFETNSSSTHSLQVMCQTMDEAKNNVYDMIKKSYKDTNYNDKYSFLILSDKKNNIYDFNLSGFEIENTDEFGNIYYIINDWVYKLQYLGMILWSYATYLIYYDNISIEQPDKFKQILIESEPYKFLCEVIKDISKKHNYIIDNIIPNFNHEIYIDKISPDELFNIEKYGKLDIKDWKQFVNTVMDANYTVTYSQEAYNPYREPIIKIF